MKYVRIIVRRRSSEGVYDGCLVDILMIVCGYVFACSLIRVKMCMMNIWRNVLRMLCHLYMISNQDYSGTHVLNCTYLYEVFNERAIFICSRVRCT